MSADMADASMSRARPSRTHGRFVTLDAMRGLAALVVVFRHSAIETTGYIPRFSYLAVDLFFLLSGFVLAFAYDDRFREGLSARGFLLLRVHRLYPIYAVGLVLSFLSAMVWYAHGLSRVQVGVVMLPALLALPAPPIGGHDNLFPLNPPFWSLFFEFWVANISFAVFWRQLRGAALLMVIAACAIGLLLSEHTFYTFDVGWSWPTAAGGVARVGFSFYVGVALARLRRSRTMKVQAPSAALLVVLLLVFAVPLRERPAHVFELLTVFAVFPLLIYFGASAKERFPEVGKALGDASYAAYAVHVPLLVAGLALLHGPHPTRTNYLLPAGEGLLLSLLFCGAVALLAWGLDLAYDRPVRRRLARMLHPSRPRLSRKRT